MPTAEAATGTLKVCQQAQDQLQNAINTVVKAEQELRENTREVRNVTLLSCTFVKISIVKFLNISKIYTNDLIQLLKS